MTRSRMRILQSQAESLTISIWMNVPGLRYIQSPSHNFMSVTQPHYNSPPTRPMTSVITRCTFRCTFRWTFASFRTVAADSS
jgi:hypothetical protein